MAKPDVESVTSWPPLSALVSLFERESTALVGRVRDWTPERWAAASHCPGWSRGDTAHHLARALAVYEHGIETAAAERPEKFRRPPRPAYDAAIVDQLAVLSRDLVAALGGCPPGTAVWHPHHHMRVEQLAAAALSETVLHRWDIDGAPLLDDSARAVIDTLHPEAARDQRRAGYDETAGELLLEVTGRGSVRDDDWKWEVVPVETR